MNIYEKILAIQAELKVPKSQYNSFGKYNFRNCEDILEAVKPICRKYRAVPFLTDTIRYIEGRHYVEATATLIDCETPEDKIIVTASAREEDNKKGMDGSQVTGASSSYARKYALNGLFAIDDTKDSDSTNNGDTVTREGSTKPKPQLETKPKTKLSQIKELIRGTAFDMEDVEAFVETNYGKNASLNDLSDEQFEKLIKVIKRNIKLMEEQSNE